MGKSGERMGKPWKTPIEVYSLENHLELCFFKICVSEFPATFDFPEVKENDFWDGS